MFQKAVTGSMSNRFSSWPRPCMGSNALMTICFRSSACSAIAQRVAGDRARMMKLPGRASKITCAAPPVIGIRMISIVDSFLSRR